MHYQYKINKIKNCVLSFFGQKLRFMNVFYYYNHFVANFNINFKFYYRFQNLYNKENILVDENLLLIK